MTNRVSLLAFEYAAWYRAAGSRPLEIIAASRRWALAFFSKYGFGFGPLVSPLPDEDEEDGEISMPSGPTLLIGIMNSPLMCLKACFAVRCTYIMEAIRNRTK